MDNFKKERLLREAIDEMLLEYGDGGGTAGDYGSGMGVSDEFFKDIFNAFVDPFRHTAAFIEKFSSEIQKMAGKLAEDVMAAYLPGYKADYDSYEKEYEERASNIMDKYSSVFARTEAHLFTGDAALMGFLYAPHQYITGRLAKSAPDAALSIIDMFAGGDPSVKQLTDKVRDVTGRMKHVGRMRGGPTSPSPIPVDVGSKKPIAEPTMKPSKWWNPRSQAAGKDASKKFYGKTHTESVDRMDEGLKDILGKFAGLFKSDKIVSAIEKSPLAQKMQVDAEKYVADYVKGVIEMTRKSIKGLKSTSSLDKATGGQFSQLIQQRGKDDTKKMAQLVVGSTKKGIKDLAIKGLKEKMGKIPKAAAPLAKIYQAGIKQIQSM